MKVERHGELWKYELIDSKGRIVVMWLDLDEMNDLEASLMAEIINEHVVRSGQPQPLTQEEIDTEMGADEYKREKML